MSHVYLICCSHFVCGSHSVPAAPVLRVATTGAAADPICHNSSRSPAVSRQTRAACVTTARQPPGGGASMERRARPSNEPWQPVGRAGPDSFLPFEMNH